VTRLVLIFPIVIACGARTELAVVGHDASTMDAAPDAHDASIDVHDAGIDVHDASTDEASVPPLCDYGTLVSDAFGATVGWNGGAALPAGHYRVTYTDGCMKYSSGQDWTVNAYANGPDTLYVVTANDAAVAPAPGTVGFFANQGAFASFDDCVAANQSDAPLEFDFAGGMLGLWLSDSPYTDNVAGESGRNPTYRLSSCP
jgi:hypothetical protein